MDWGAIEGNLLLVVLLIGIGILVFLFRWGRRPERTRAEIVRNLLTEVRMNQALAEIFHRQSKPRNFEVVCWQVNKSRLGFFTKSLQDTVSEAFVMAENYNQEIKTARKQKSGKLFSDIDTDKLKAPLAKARQGLEQWLQLHVGTKEPPPPKYPGIFDMLFGSRGD